MATWDYRWLGTIYPTPANAQDAEMSLSEYEDFVYGACLLDMENPIGYWVKFSAWQQNIVDWLKGKNDVHIIGPGTDIKMKITGRQFENCNGRKNMPDGEVCVSPVETSVEGKVYFSYPGIYSGQEVEGVRLWFENGQVVKATAEKGDPFLQEILKTDDGARRLGELGIGTNKGITKFTRNTLFDEKITGTFHLALGASLPETGGVNQSAIHWDIVADLRESGEIWVDEVLLYKDGNFVIEF
jgi:aminopeptidase